MTQVTDEASLVCWHPFSSSDDMCPSDTDRASRICGHISGDSMPLYLLLESADGTSASAATAGQWICDGLTPLSKDHTGLARTSLLIWGRDSCIVPEDAQGRFYVPSFRCSTY